MTYVVWALVGLVLMLCVLVVGLLRSHATIVRALHDAGINLDPDHQPPRSPASSSASGLHEPRPTTELYTDTPPDIRTIAGVPTPADVTGARAADLIGMTAHGATRAISMQGRQPTLLAFLTTGCATCAEFWRSFGTGVRLPAELRLVIVTKGPAEESPADVAALAPPGYVTIQSSEAWNDYRIPVAPYFVLVDGERGVVVGEGAAHSWELVRQLLDRALADAGYGKATMKRRDLFLGRTRARRVDQELLEAGIVPGDPQLYHPTIEPSTHEH
ncbi:MAG: hypothetical protein R2706_15790 [Acidimicrobiales bacterium]